MVQVELTKIIIDEKRQEQIIVLKEKEGTRQFPIVIGFLEASSIKIKLSNTKIPRPMAHDLLVSIIKELGGQLERVVIDQLKDNTFHAKLMICTPQGKTKAVDSRPSDAIAVAVRTHTPLFAREEVIKKAAFFKT